MLPPRHTTDPCYYWKMYRLDRIAARMKTGVRIAPVIQFSDSEKVDIALRLKRDHALAGVWLTEGRLYYRDFFQGPLIRISWRDAGLLTGFITSPHVAGALKRKEPHQVRALRQRQRLTA